MNIQRPEHFEFSARTNSRTFKLKTIMSSGSSHMLHACTNLAISTTHLAFASSGLFVTGGAEIFWQPFSGIDLTASTRIPFAGKDAPNRAGRSWNSCSGCAWIIEMNDCSLSVLPNAENHYYEIDVPNYSHVHKQVYRHLSKSQKLEVWISQANKIASSWVPLVFTLSVYMKISLLVVWFCLMCREFWWFLQRSSNK